MSSEYESTPKSGGRKIALVMIAGVYVLASLFLIFDARGRTAKLEADQASSKASTRAALEKFDQHLDSTDSTMRAATDTLAQKLGMTEKDLQARTAELQQQQKASVSQLEKQQKEQIEGVKTEVGSVRTEVGSVKSDVDATKSDLQGTKEKLERTVGDLGAQSGLIARTREDLETLKRRGERNYYEFALLKGQHGTGVSTVSLQLKNADPKHGKYTLTVLADDRLIEKKDRTMFEPLQFYNGRDRQLYEVVVLTVDKNKVTGYLSTPKELVAMAQ